MRIFSALALLVAMQPHFAAAAPAESTPVSSPSPSSAISPSPTPTPSVEDEKLLREIEAAMPPSGATVRAPDTPPSAAGGIALSNAFNPAFSLDGLFAASAFSSPDAKELGGHDPSPNGMNLQNLELTAQANVDPYLRANANIVFGLESVEVEEAYFTTVPLVDGLDLKAGQFFTWFGRQNQRHPHSWEFTDQNLVEILMFGPDGLRNPGVQASYLLPIPIFSEFIATVQDARGPTAVSFLGESPARKPRHGGDLLYTGRLTVFIPAGDSLSVYLGTSAATGPNPTSPDARTVIAGADLYVKLAPAAAKGKFAYLQAEAIGRRYDVAKSRQTDDGVYVQIGGRFAKRWETGVRFDETRSDRVLDPLLVDTWRHRTSVQLTFRPTEFSKFRLQGSDDFSPTFREGVTGLALQFEFLIGAHGTHTF